MLDWVRGVAFGISHEMLQQILNFPAMLNLRRSLLNSFLYHSKNRKGSLESPKRLFGVPGMLNMTTFPTNFYVATDVAYYKRVCFYGTFKKNILF